ncbi:hypothetical protein [Segatella copri]|uniref:hypothetical protein n=1 Tax=Segatella copri TaxID=165179 RepID=UPI0011C22742|nr:hypothetical protein [Segatella copri]
MQGTQVMRHKPHPTPSRLDEPPAMGHQLVVETDHRQQRFRTSFSSSRTDTQPRVFFCPSPYRLLFSD